MFSDTNISYMNDYKMISNQGLTMSLFSEPIKNEETNVHVRNALY